MRPIALTALAILTASMAAAPASASSIEVINGTRAENGSIVSMKCASCPPLRQPQTISRYKVPELDDAVQKEEIRDVNGQRMIVRTERWMGGAPIIFMNRLTPELEAAMNTPLPVPAGDPAPAIANVGAPDGIDASATTSAVTDGAHAAPESLAGFELRLK